MERRLTRVISFTLNSRLLRAALPFILWSSMVGPGQSAGSEEAWLRAHSRCPASQPVLVLAEATSTEGVRAAWIRDCEADAGVLVVRPAEGKAYEVDRTAATAALEIGFLSDGELWSQFAYEADHIDDSYSIRIYDANDFRLRFSASSSVEPLLRDLDADGLVELVLFRDPFGVRSAETENAPNWPVVVRIRPEIALLDLTQFPGLVEELRVVTEGEAKAAKSRCARASGETCWFSRHVDGLERQAERLREVERGP